jgi:cytochrome c biogenesis protein CcmG/thiol:disulfide interchange protein DsbE
MSSLRRRQLLALIPLGFAGAAGFAFWRMLDRMSAGKFDPHDIGNPLLNKPMPNFALGPVEGAAGFTAADVRAAAAKQPLLVNFYASWCIPCAQEADVLAAIAAQNIPLWGIAYEDKPAALKQYLDRYGNPYQRLASDRTGSVAIDFGVYGVPETFLIDRAGIIRWHRAGPLTEDSVRDELQPALRAVA